MSKHYPRKWQIDEARGEKLERIAGDDIVRSDVDGMWILEETDRVDGYKFTTGTVELHPHHKVAYRILLNWKREPWYRQGAQGHKYQRQLAKYERSVD